MPSLEEQMQAAHENSVRMAEESGGALKVPSQEETERLYNNDPQYVNKFMATMMKNNMVAIGLCVEYVPNKDAKFIDSFVCTIQDIAGLHQLLTKMLTAFQQEQAKMIQAMQGKVNPGFVEQIKAMQDAQKGDRPAAIQKPAEGLVK